MKYVPSLALFFSMHSTQSCSHCRCILPLQLLSICLYVVVLLCITPIRDFGHHLLIRTDEWMNKWKPAPRPTHFLRNTFYSLPFPPFRFLHSHPVLPTVGFGKYYGWHWKLTHRTTCAQIYIAPISPIFHFWALFPLFSNYRTFIWPCPSRKQVERWAFWGDFWGFAPPFEHFYRLLFGKLRMLPAGHTLRLRRICRK